MVQYKDNTYDSVPNHILDELIEAGRIVAFRRADGWAEIGKDPIRGRGEPNDYAGPERRAAAANRNCLTCADFIDSLCRREGCPTRISLQGKGSPL
jgi:hypothetical protein